MKYLQKYVNTGASTHNLLFSSTAGGGQSGWWIKKRGCCRTIGEADCLRGSGQLRVSVTGPPTPPVGFLRLSRQTAALPPSQHQVKGEGGSVEPNWPLCLPWGLFGLHQRGSRTRTQTLKSQSGWGGELGWAGKQHFWQSTHTAITRPLDPASPWQKSLTGSSVILIFLQSSFESESWTKLILLLLKLSDRTRCFLDSNYAMFEAKWLIYFITWSFKTTL